MKLFSARKFQVDSAAPTLATNVGSYIHRRIVPSTRDQAEKMPERIANPLLKSADCKSALAGGY
jgi:hypothetical protein